MNKSIVNLLIIGVLLVSLIACSDSSNNSIERNSLVPTEAYSSIIRTQEPVKDDEMNCILLIDGKDITKGNYVKINHDVWNAELPLLAILNELGAEVSWVCENVVKIKFVDKTLEIDVAEVNFGISLPPGTKNGIRKFIDKEVILDDSSARVVLSHFAGASVRVDFDKSIIYIEKNQF